MSRARYPLPTDLVALVSFDGSVYPNEAKPWDRLGLAQRARPWEEALEQWFSFATGKHTWVNVRGATIRGLISARKRAKRTAWEVEVLIDADSDTKVVSNLFGRMVQGVGRTGAERIFVRLEEDSQVVRGARDAGFFPYQRQTLYRLAKRRAIAEPGLPMRVRAKDDLHGVYQLYSRVVPANVRGIEGATLREWQAALEPWGGRTHEFVLDEDGAITGWLRLLPGAVGRLAVLGVASHIEDLLRAGLSQMTGDGPVLVLAADHETGLHRALQDLGFEAEGEYVLMAKRLVILERELVPETTGTAVPVN
ncbi:MAG TPA: hypothetical protein VFP63_01775 [Dehalococcoidia bacterium]|nr:hypothetical protein [Dehalococcoidia bacterium]